MTGRDSFGLRDSPGADLVGLENRLKSAQAFHRKVADGLSAAPLTSVDDIAGRIGDALRYTYVASTEAYTDVSNNILRGLADGGFESVKPLKNCWGGDDYQGITTTWRDAATSQPFEVQLHTHESLAAREATFPIDLRLRDLSGEHGPEEHCSCSRTTYYLLYFDNSDAQAHPVGPVRECSDATGRAGKAEAFGRDGEWAYTNVLLSLRRGDQSFDEVEVGAERAGAFERNLRRQLGLSSRPDEGE